MLKRCEIAEFESELEELANRLEAADLQLTTLPPEKPAAIVPHKAPAPCPPQATAADSIHAGLLRVRPPSLDPNRLPLPCFEPGGRVRLPGEHV
jgi:hypothetical protein